METNDEILNSKKEFNRKLFLIYKALSWDLLFFYTVSFLFLTIEKKLTPAEIVFGEAFYPLFKFILQIPSTIIIEKLGKRKSIIFSNFLIVIYVFLIIGLVNVHTLAIANIFCAFGYLIKAIAEPSLLYDSLDENSNKQKEFSKNEGKGVAWYFYIDSASALVTGFLFVINSYLPMIISLAITIIVTYLSFKFKELPNDKIPASEKEKTVIKEISIYMKDLFEAFKFIFKSGRLKALLLFHGVFSSFLYIMTTLRRSLLAEIGISSEQFGLIFAFLGIIGGISSDYSYKIHSTHKNKTLSFLGIIFSISVLFSGLSVMLHLPKFLMYFSVLICYTLQYISRSPYNTLIKQYLSSFSTSSMRVKILSATILIEGTSNALLAFIISKVLDFLPTSNTIFLLGTIFSLILLLVLEYMKTRVGLKPEEYPSTDIKFNEIN